MTSRRKFSKEFKLAAVARLRGGESVGAVARALEVSRHDLYRWQRALEEHGGQAFPGLGRKRAEQDQVAVLERKIGQQALEIDFLKRALQRVDEQRRLRAAMGGAPSTSKSDAK